MEDPMWRQALDGEGSGDSDDLPILVRAIEQDLGLGVGSDRAVDLLARHALVDVRVLGNRLQGHVRNALVYEAASNVAGHRRDRTRRQLTVELSLLPEPGIGVGEQVPRV